MPEFKGRLRTPRLAAAPASPITGEMYYDTGTNQLVYWNGTAWTAGGAGASDPLKVDKDSVVVAASRIVANKLLAGDAQPAFRLLGNGTMEWGPGGAGGLDISLARIAGPRLITNGGISAVNLATGSGDNQILLSQDGRIYFSSGLDTSLHRLSASVLRASASLQASYELVARAGGPSQITLGDLGNSLPTIWFGSANDTALYRPAAGQLKTDGQFYATGAVAFAWNAYGWTVQANGDGSLLVQTEIYARSASGNQVKIGWYGSDYPGITFGLAGDTALYRSGTGVLQTSGRLYVADVLYASLGANQVGLGTMGPAGQGGLNINDVTLYRYAAGKVALEGYDGTLRITGAGIPRWTIYATGGPVNARKWQCYVDPSSGFLRFGAINDAEDSQSTTVHFERDGQVNAPKMYVFGTAGAEQSNLYLMIDGIVRQVSRRSDGLLYA